MAKLTKVSETLYIPLLGRIFSSKNYPKLFNDEYALNLWDKLPETIKNAPEQEEYTHLASAVRSKNNDIYIKEFLQKNPNGNIVNIGCGLESLFERNDNGKAKFFELDLMDVLELRKEFFPEKERDYYLPYSAFDYKWFDKLKEISSEPVLIIASGLFHYFKEEQVIDFVNNLEDIAPVELLFDAVSSSGIKRSRKYMEKMGRQDALMYFSVDSAKEFANKCKSKVVVIKEEKYYSHIDYSVGIKFSTKVKMKVSDMFNMVKMIHLKVEK